MTDIRILLSQAKLEVANHAKKESQELTKALLGLQSDIQERERKAKENNQTATPSANQSSSPSKG